MTGRAKPRGRPTKYTPEVVELILAALERGAPTRVAAGAAGVAASTVHQWQADYPEFLEAVARARARAVVTDITLIQAAALTDWRAAVAHLQLCYPAEFGRHRVEVEAKTPTPEITDLDERIAALLVARAPAPPPAPPAVWNA